MSAKSLVSKVVLGGAVAAIHLSGCSPSGAGDQGLTVLIAVTAVANEPRPTLTAAARKELAAAIDGDNATLRVVVSAPERPRVTAESELKLLRGTRIEHDPDRRATLAAREIDRVADLVAASASNHAHLDLLGLLDTVARTPGPVVALVVSSGLQTTGPLAIDRLDWDQVGAHAVIEQARALGLIPDLRGKRVVFSGIGEVTAPQEPLPAPLRARLADMWLGLCRAGGGDCVGDSDPKVGGPPLSTTPVPTVAVPRLPEIPLAAKAISLPSDILFGPDSADLLASAEPTLAKVAAAMTPGRTARLVGHTASVGPAQSARALSLRRAQAVRDALVRHGVPSSALTVDGVGYDQPVVADRDATGALIPAAAQQNRTVIVSLQ